MGPRFNRKALGRLVNGAVMAGLLGVPGTAHAQPPYTFEKINFPGSIATHPSGINDSGLIIGTFLDAERVAHGFKYENGFYTVVDFPGATHSHVIGLNDLGQMVGSHSLTGLNGPWHSFLFNGVSFEQFDFPGWESDTRGINNTGDLVGVYNAGGSLPTHGFLRTGANVYSTIDHPGAAYTFAEGINDAGMISGSYIDAAGGTHGFVRTGPSSDPIDYPGALGTYVAGSNEETLVGYQFQAGTTHGFVYSNLSFRSFDVNLPGVTSSRGMAINDAGKIAGVYFAPDCPEGCGFLAQPTAGAPLCDQQFTLSYSGGVLTLNFTLETAAATTWEAWLLVQGAVIKLWTFPLAAVPGGLTLPVPLPGVPPLGQIVGLSSFRTATAGMACVDFAVVDSGSPTP